MEYLSAEQIPAIGEKPSVCDLDWANDPKALQRSLLKYFKPF
jgi:hypothetical protein